MEHTSFAKVVYVLALIATIIGFTAFSQTPKDSFFRKEQPAKNSDTGKSGRLDRNDNNRKFDQLELQLKHLDAQLGHLDEQMKQLDLNKTQMQLETAMKKLEKENFAHIEESLKKIEWNKLNEQFQENLSVLEKVKMPDMKKELEQMKSVLEQHKMQMHSLAEIDTKKIKNQVENAMKDAKQSMQKAKEELQNYRDFIDALQKDGLIDKSKPFKIEFKGGELYLDGNKQPKEVRDKYKKFYRKDSFTIDVNENDGTHI